MAALSEKRDATSWAYFEAKNRQKWPAKRHFGEKFGLKKAIFGKMGTIFKWPYLSLQNELRGESGLIRKLATRRT